MPPDPNDQMVDPQVSNDDLEAWLTEMEESNASYSLPGDQPTPLTIEPPTDTTAEPVPDEEPPEEEPEEEPEPREPDSYLINGNQFAREDIERLYQFDQYLRQNPDAARRVAEALPSPGTPVQSSVPAPEAPAAPQEYEPPTPPDYLDLEDPTVKWQWETHVANQKHNYDVEQRFQRWVEQNQQVQQQQTERQAAYDMQEALATFREQYPGLNDDDISQIRNAAGPYVSPMMQTLPPVEALRRSMEVAAWADADLRPKLGTDSPSPTVQQKSRTRKQRLSSISGSPRSAPKTEDRVQYHTDKDMINALARGIAESGFNGSN